MNNDKRHIYVSAAVITDKCDRILIARRPVGADMELLWEFPGGKLEATETPAEALKRELKEELDIDAECGGVIYEETFDYPDKIVTLFFIEVRAFRGEIKALEHEQLTWVKAEEMGNYQFPPADDDFIAFLNDQGIAK